MHALRAYLLRTHIGGLTTQLTKWLRLFEAVATHALKKKTRGNVLYNYYIYQISVEPRLSGLFYCLDYFLWFQIFFMMKIP